LKKHINFNKLVRRVCLVLFLVLVLFNILAKADMKVGFGINVASLFGSASSDFDVIKQDVNKNYSGKRTGKSF